MIVGIAGAIASGKSTLGRTLAARFSAKLVSFGDYVRRVARARGIDTSDRRALQDLGQSLVAQGVDSFVSNVLEGATFQNRGHIILDGIRHDVVWTEVLAFASQRGEPAKLIFLEMPEGERQKRLAVRGLSGDQVSTYDRHESETDVQQKLRQRADLRIDAMQDAPAMVATVGYHLGIS